MCVHVCHKFAYTGCTYWCVCVFEFVFVVCACVRCMRACMCVHVYVCVYMRICTKCMHVSL